MPKDVLKDKNTLDSFGEESKKKAPSLLMQGVVFFGGVTIAVLFAFVFNLKVSGVLSQNYRDTEITIHKEIQEEIRSFEDATKVAGTLLSYMGQRSFEDVRNEILYSVSDIKKMDRVLWIRQSYGGSWKATDIININTETQGAYPEWSQDAMQNLIAYLVSSRSKYSKGTAILSYVPGTKYWQISEELIVRSRPVAIVSLLPSDSTAKVNMLVSMTRFSNVIDDQWINEHPDVSEIAISDAANGDVVLQLGMKNANDNAIDDLMRGKGFIFTSGGSEWKIHMNIGQSKLASVLIQIQFLIIALGVVFSFVMAMLYKSVDTKSLKLKRLNNAYLQKNYELNIEVSERERLHNLLFTAEKEFRMLVDSVSDIVLEVSPQGEVIFVNRAWESITGFSVDDVLKKSFFDFIHQQDLPDLRSNFNQVFRGQRFSYQSALRVSKKDGSFRQVRVSIATVSNEQKQYPRLVVTITDVEAQQRTKQALTEVEEKYRTMIENAAGGFYQITMQGQVLSMNPALVDIMGYDSEDQMREKMNDAFRMLFQSTKDKARFMKELEVHNAIKHFENKVITNKRQEIWINQNARSVKDDDGNILYIEGSVENVTERKEFEQKLKQAKIESDLANRAKSEFLANMSHELRTPLNSIIGFSEIIKDEVLGPLQNKQYWDYANDIHKSGRNLLTIINEILDVSRIETGERQLNEINVNLNKVIDSCFDFAKKRMEESSELTITNLSQGKLPNVIGEELAIKQIFINILSNAIKFTPSGGRITLSHELSQTGELRVSITDTGIGLDEHEIDKALSPFGQVDTALNRSDSGAGLGLNLVNSLIKLHGGKLELFSQKGIGTTVTVMIPPNRVAQDSSRDDSSAVSKRNVSDAQSKIYKEQYQRFFSETDKDEAEDSSNPTIQ